MKISLKQAILNKYNIISFIFVPVVSFFAWTIQNHFSFFKTLARGAGPHGEPLMEYMRDVYGFFGYAVWGFSYMQVILPLLASFIMLPYLREKRMYNYSYTREKSYPSAVLKPMLRQLFIGCTILFLGYMVFLCIGLNWQMDPHDVIRNNVIWEEGPDGSTAIDLWEIDSEGVLAGKYPDIRCNRVFMPEIFGEFFAVKNMFMYFVVDGFWKYFVFSFIYGLFSVGISFYTKKDFLCLIIPSVYYIVLDIVFSGLGGNFTLYAPSYTIMSGASEWVSIPQVIYPLLPPLLFAVFTLVRELAVKKKRRDAYAV